VVPQAIFDEKGSSRPSSENIVLTQTGSRANEPRTVRLEKRLYNRHGSISSPCKVPE
jgi:hypothetical protein